MGLGVRLGVLVSDNRSSSISSSWVDSCEAGLEDGLDSSDSPDIATAEAISWMSDLARRWPFLNGGFNSREGEVDRFGMSELTLSKLSLVCDDGINKLSVLR